MNPQTKQLYDAAKAVIRLRFISRPFVVLRDAITAYEQSTEQVGSIAEENYITSLVNESFKGLAELIHDNDLFEFYKQLIITLYEDYTAPKDQKITELTNLLSDTNKRIQEIQDEEELKDKQLQVQQSHIDDQDQLIFEQDKEIKELKEAISELIQVKDWKDKHGKDEHYLKAISIAWENVRKLIQK